MRLIWMVTIIAFCLTSIEADLECGVVTDPVRNPMNVLIGESKFLAYDPYGSDWRCWNEVNLIVWRLRWTGEILKAQVHDKI